MNWKPVFSDYVSETLNSSFLKVSSLGDYCQINEVLVNFA